MDKRERDALILHYGDTVREAAEQASSLIMDRLMAVKDLPPVARYLLYGRVVMRIFQSHFYLSYEAAEKREVDLAKDMARAAEVKP